jgi:Flp pilus assembly protein TadD
MSATRERFERAEQARGGRRSRSSAVPPGLRPHKRMRLHLRIAGIAAAAGAVAGIGLLRASPPRAAAELELAEPQRVGTGPSAAPVPEPAAAGARVEALALERDPSGTRLRIELDAPASHRMEVSPGGRELALILRGARLAEALGRVDLSGTEIEWLDVRPEPPDLRVVVGLREPRLVTSASYPTERGTALVVDLLARGAEAQHPAAPAEADAAEQPAPAAGAVKRPASPPGGDARYARALAAERSGRLDEARAELVEALAHEPGHAAARLRLAHLEVARGARDAALRVIQEGRALEPVRADLALFEARLLADQQRNDEAVAALESIPREARGAEFHALHGALLAGQGAHARAVEAFSAALRLEPQRGPAWLGLAISLEAEGRAGEARTAYRRALQAGGIEPAARAWAEERSARLEAAP